MFALFVIKSCVQNVETDDGSFEVIAKYSDSTVESQEQKPNDKNLESPNFQSDMADMITGTLPDGSQIQFRCVASSLSEALVTQLASHLRQKLGSSGLPALACTTDALDGLDNENSEMAALFSHQGEYLVCLLDSSLQKLDVFHDQLLDYIRQQMPVFVKASSSAAAAEAAAAAFACWEDATVAALQRTVKLLRNVLPQLLTLVFVGCELTVECSGDGSEQRRREVTRFIGQCRLLDTTEATAASATKPGPDTPEAPQSAFPRSGNLRISGRSVALDYPHCTEFAKSWSAALLDSVDAENPVRLQQRILDLKLQASRDVNAAKRLLVEAVGDYYALYRLVQALRLTGNSAVLLHSLGSLVQASPDEREVVACAADFLAASCPLLPAGPASAAFVAVPAATE